LQLDLQEEVQKAPNEVRKVNRPANKQCTHGEGRNALEEATQVMKGFNNGNNTNKKVG